MPREGCWWMRGLMGLGCLLGPLPSSPSRVAGVSGPRGLALAMADYPVNLDDDQGHEVVIG